MKAALKPNVGFEEQPQNMPPNNGSQVSLGGIDIDQQIREEQNQRKMSKKNKKQKEFDQKYENQVMNGGSQKKRGHRRNNSDAKGLLDSSRKQ